MPKYLINYGALMSATCEIEADNMREAIEILQEDIDNIVNNSYDITYEDIIAEDVEDL